jgi:hypothetical protein
VLPIEPSLRFLKNNGAATAIASPLLHEASPAGEVHCDRVG